MVGQPCNGCGLCCLVEPCPVGMVLSRRRSGACRALRWSESQQRYLCGAISGPDDGWPALMKPVAPWWAYLVKRWVAAGQGCDATLHADRP